MNNDQELKLQAFLDGELPARERPAVADWLAADAEARALQQEWALARSALAGGEPPRPLPESREFYWSKIQREILRGEKAGPRAAARRAVPWWRRLLVPTAGLAVLTLGLSVALNYWPPGRQPHVVETALADSGAFTYRDLKEGITLVWLSYPADSGLADDAGADTIE